MKEIREWQEEELEKGSMGVRGRISSAYETLKIPLRQHIATYHVQ